MHKVAYEKNIEVDQSLLSKYARERLGIGGKHELS